MALVLLAQIAASDANASLAVQMFTVTLQVIQTIALAYIAQRWRDTPQNPA